MDWNDVRVFLAVARAGTLGAAGRALGQSQPTMGRRLAVLERSLGHSLFQRTSDGFVLTIEGEAMLAHAERMEEEALAVERRLSGASSSIGGMLRVASSDWFGVVVLAPLLAELGRVHPELELELLTDQRPYSLARREADIAFRIVPFGEADVISRKFATISYGVYVARELPKKHRLERVVTMDAAFAEMPDAKWLRRRLPRAVVAYRSNNRQVQATLCANGGGLAVLPRPLAERTPGLLEVDLGEAPPSRDTFMGYHRDLRRAPRVQAFLEFMREMAVHRFGRS